MFPRTAIPAEQLRQVLMNVLRNAVQAVKSRGRISIDTKSRTRGREDFVVIRIADNGTGIARSSLSQIFLPFYTTKESGTGLGLAICQRIVQEAGGRIDVRSELGEGTTFEIRLPAASEVLATPTPSSAVLADSADAEHTTSTAGGEGSSSCAERSRPAWCRGERCGLEHTLTRVPTTPTFTVRESATENQRPGYSLRFLSGKCQGSDYALQDATEVMVGRSADADLVLLEGMVSRFPRTLLHH